MSRYWLTGPYKSSLKALRVGVNMQYAKNLANILLILNCHSSWLLQIFRFIKISSNVYAVTQLEFQGLPDGTARLNCPSRKPIPRLKNLIDHHVLYQYTVLGGFRLLFQHGNITRAIKLWKAVKRQNLVYFSDCFLFLVYFGPFWVNGLTLLRLTWMKQKHKVNWITTCNKVKTIENK